MTNLAHTDAFSSLKSELHRILIDELTRQQDPRVLGDGSVFDRYPYTGQERFAWDRMKRGELLRLNFLSETDFEPQASGLEVTWEE